VIAAAVLLPTGFATRAAAGTAKPRVAKRALAFSAILLAIAFCRTWGVFRWIAHIGHDNPPAGAAIRIVHWNLSQYDAPESIDVGERLSSEGTPDIVFSNTQHNPRLWDQITRAMAAQGKGEKITFVYAGPFKIFSRFPARQIASVRVPLSGSPDLEHLQAPPFARKLFSGILSLINVQNRNLDRIEDATIVACEFDTTATLGRKTIGWHIDLPSNPLVAKSGVASHVAAAIERAKKDSGLPVPDFIAGDFNTPGGSASLNTYAPGFTDAADTAGLGRLATWPRPTSLLHIDHILISPQWRAIDYRVIDVGTSEHKAQTAVIWPAPAK
jgi:hypothetical protein